MSNVSTLYTIVARMAGNGARIKDIKRRKEAILNKALQYWTTHQ
jgi:hypothetical protein